MRTETDHSGKGVDVVADICTDYLISMPVQYEPERYCFEVAACERGGGGMDYTANKSDHQMQAEYVFISNISKGDEPTTAGCAVICDVSAVPRSIRPRLRPRLRQFPARSRSFV